jgi:hypothetical protein
MWGWIGSETQPLADAVSSSRHVGMDSTPTRRHLRQPVFGGPNWLPRRTRPNTTPTRRRLNRRRDETTMLALFADQPDRVRRVSPSSAAPFAVSCGTRNAVATRRDPHAKPHRVRIFSLGVDALRITPDMRRFSNRCAIGRRPPCAPPLFYPVDKVIPRMVDTWWAIRSIGSEGWGE